MAISGAIIALLRYGALLYSQSPDTAEARKFSRLSDAELKRQTRLFTAGLRRFQRDSIDRIGSSMFNTRSHAEAEQAERLARLDLDAELRDDFLPTGRALRTELLTRLGAAEPNPNSDDDDLGMLLNWGTYDGPDSISRAAAYLEELARALP